MRERERERERERDHTLYPSKEMNWFGIKYNIKIEGYKLKFLEWWGNSIFLFSF